MGPFQKWLTSNVAGLTAATALTCSAGAGLFVSIAQVRCTMLEEEVAGLKGRLADTAESLKAEQETTHKAVLGVVNDAVKRLASHIEEAREGEANTPATEDSPRPGASGGVE
jgi:hypothetical protein